MAIIFAVSGANAASTYKCVINGSTVFQDTPCPSNQARKVPSPAELNAAEKKRRESAPKAPVPTHTTSMFDSHNGPSRFICDGRQHCSQMQSCEEAKYFLANCPGVKMDGNNDGVPCEQQWCTR